MLLLLLASLFRLITELADTSPLSRPSVFAIALSTGILIVCAVYWMSRIIFYIIAARFFMERSNK